jgi:hypothetical protein
VHPMEDLLFLALTAVCAGVCLLYVVGCEKL